MSISLDIDIQLTRNVSKFDREIKKSRILSKFVTSTASSSFEVIEAMKSSSIFRKLSIASQMIIQMITQNEDDDETKNEIENENENEIDEEEEDDVKEIKNEILTQTQS